MKTITVFTPTYNRAYCLSSLYQSLVSQITDDFIWLVVDDGSTDDTQTLVESFVAEGKIDIEYYRKENGGKHTAHNLGVDLCKTELFVCVDSDDHLKPNAIKTILDIHKSNLNEKLLGYYLRKEYCDGRPMASSYPDGLTRVGISDLYHRYSFVGDTVIVLRTELIKPYSFPVFQEERFVTESVFYNSINHIAPMLLCEDSIYVGEYLPDGYTKNIKRLMAKNPYGTALSELTEARYSCGFVARTKHYSQYLSIIRVFSLDKERIPRIKINPLIKLFALPLMIHYVPLYEKIKESIKQQ